MKARKSVATNAGILGNNLMNGVSQFEGAMYTKSNGSQGGHYHGYQGGNNKLKGNQHLCNCFKIVGHLFDFRHKKKGSIGDVAAYNVSSDNDSYEHNL